MANKIALSVTSADDENGSGNSSSATMNFDSLAELARLLKMAGVQCDAPGGMQPASGPEGGEVYTSPDDEEEDQHLHAKGPIDLNVGPDGAITMATDENADYDYRLNPTSRKGFVYNVDPYSYEGDAELDTRDVPARSGDNPLKKVGTHRTFESYLKIVEDKKIREKPKKVRKGTPEPKLHKKAKEAELAKDAKIQKSSRKW